MEHESLTALGDALRRDFQSLQHGYLMDCWDKDYLTADDLPEWYVAELSGQWLFETADEFLELLAWLTARFIPLDWAKPVEGSGHEVVDVAQSAASWAPDSILPSPSNSAREAQASSTYGAVKVQTHGIEPINSNAASSATIQGLDRSAKGVTSLGSQALSQQDRTAVRNNEDKGQARAMDSANSSVQEPDSGADQHDLEASATGSKETGQGRVTSEEAVAPDVWETESEVERRRWASGVTEAERTAAGRSHPVPQSARNEQPNSRLEPTLQTDEAPRSQPAAQPVKGLKDFAQFLQSRPGKDDSCIETAEADSASDFVGHIQNVWPPYRDEQGQIASNADGGDDPAKVKESTAPDAWETESGVNQQNLESRAPEAKGTASMRSHPVPQPARNEQPNSQLESTLQTDKAPRSQLTAQPVKGLRDFVQALEASPAATGEWVETQAAADPVVTPWSQGPLISDQKSVSLASLEAEVQPQSASSNPQIASAEALSALPKTAKIARPMPALQPNQAGHDHPVENLELLIPNAAPDGIISPQTVEPQPPITLDSVPLPTTGETVMPASLPPRDTPGSLSISHVGTETGDAQNWQQPRAVDFPTRHQVDMHHRQEEVESSTTLDEQASEAISPGNRLPPPHPSAPSPAVFVSPEGPMAEMDFPVRSTSAPTFQVDNQTDMNLDYLLDAIAREIYREYKQFYGS